MILYLVRVVTCVFASGYRQQTSGAFGTLGSNGYCWSSIATGNNGFRLGYNSSAVELLNGSSRAYSFPIRCVQHLFKF